MKSFNHFKTNKLTKEESRTLKGGGANGEMGVFCEWYISHTGNSNMPAVHSDTNPGVANMAHINKNK